MSPSGRPASRDDFRIAVICALRTESDAVYAMFDEDWEDGPKYAKVENDTNAYTMGRIGVHNVVLAYMPGIGKVSAATLTSKLNFTFPQIRLGLVVGICGGMPFIRETIRDPRDIDVFLGDVIISTQVAQYDLGHQYSNELIAIDTLQNTLGRPKEEIRAFLHKIQGPKDRKRLEHRIRGYLADVLQQEYFKRSNYQGEDNDRLYESKYRHKHQEKMDCPSAICGNDEDKVCKEALLSTCEDLKCNLGKQVRRNRSKKDGNVAANSASVSKEGAEAPSPRVHFGLFASGDSVVKSADHRDNLADRMEAVGFEMEGSGAWESIPVVVIKSVVDYADSHKSYLWQKYGALCGAACMKAFVNEWMPTEKTPQPGIGSGGYHPIS